MYVCTYNRANIDSTRLPDGCHTLQLFRRTMYLYYPRQTLYECRQCRISRNPDTVAIKQVWWFCRISIWYVTTPRYTRLTRQVPHQSELTIRRLWVVSIAYNIDCASCSAQREPCGPGTWGRKTGVTERPRPPLYFNCDLWSSTWGTRTDRCVAAKAEGHTNHVHVHVDISTYLSERCRAAEIAPAFTTSRYLISLAFDWSAVTPEHVVIDAVGWIRFKELYNFFLKSTNTAMQLNLRNILVWLNGVDVAVLR